MHILFQAIFSLNLLKYIIFSGYKGAAFPFLIGKCVFGNQKCIISVPFASTFIHIYNLWVARG